MTPERLIKYVNNPIQSNSPTTEELWQLVKEYPYFQVARLMLARNLSDKQHEAFPLALRLAAAYAGDRSLLKKLIEHKLETILTIQDAKEEKTVYSEKEVKSPEIIVSNKPIDCLDNQEESIKSKVIIEEILEIKPTPETFSAQATETEKELTKTPEPDIIVNTQNSFYNQLRKRLLEVPIDETPGEVEVVQNAEKVENEPNEEIEDEGENNIKLRNQQELIDKFIREEPRISTPKKEFFNPEDIAKQSTLLPDDIVTETLATVYEQQGHFTTAIKIYERLMLLFPEKSRYFAARIEEIQKKRK